MRVHKQLDPTLLLREIRAASIALDGLVTVGVNPGDPLEQDVLQPGPDGQGVELPEEAFPIVEAHVAPPRVIDYAGVLDVNAITETTDDVPLEVFRFPCETAHLYRANLRIFGVDRGNFVSKAMEGRFVWKRANAAAVMVGITVVSDIRDAAAASWAPNAVASGNDIVFTVKGATGRTIDWFLTGEVGQYAPGGLGA